MADVTAGRSAGTHYNSELDPTRPAHSPGAAHAASPGAPEEPVRILQDVTAGRSAGTVWNALKDPTRAATVDDPRR
jgi:hypothetical protein